MSDMAKSPGGQIIVYRESLDILYATRFILVRISCSARRRAGGRGLAPKRHAFRREGACPRGSTAVRGHHRGQAPPNSMAEPVPCAAAAPRRENQSECVLLFCEDMRLYGNCA